MNTISKLLTAGVLSLGLFIAQSCVQDDDYSTPPLDCPDKPQANISIKDLVAQTEARTLNLDENGMIADDLIVEGIVITSDESGNMSNTISFQDKAEGATAGIQIELAERPVYGLYPIGSTIQVKLKGLKVAYDRGTIRIGTKLTGSQATTYDLDRIPKELRTKVFAKYCDQVQEIKPKVVNSIADALKPENLNTLVTINNVQFKSPESDVSYYPAGATSTAENVRLIDRNGRETDLRTSTYANFKGTKLPTTSGSITVLVSRYNSTYQVFIRDTNDVKFDQPRFGSGSSECSELSTPNITIPELLAKVNAGSLVLGPDKSITEDLIVHAYVITSDESGNLFKTISLQDKPSNPTAGIQIEIDQNNLFQTYPLGSKVQVNLKGLVVGLDRGVIKIGSVDPTYAVGRILSTEIAKYLVKSCDAAQPIQPKVVASLEEALKPENLNTLVSISNVQFKNPTVDKTYGTTSATVNRLLEDKQGNTVDLRNSSFAKWASTPLPTGSGSITVLVSRFNSTYQVFIRDTNDVKFDQPRFNGATEELSEIKGSSENFESARKINYGAGDLVLSTGEWTFNDGGIFSETDTNDLKHSGTGSVRLRGTSSTDASIQTKFYVTGLKRVKLYLGGATFNEGTDADKEIKIEVLFSTDSGKTWKSAGEKTSVRGTMNLLEFPISSSANDKVVVKLVNKSFLRSTGNRLRVNVDDVEFVK